MFWGEHRKRLLTVNYFVKKVPSLMFVRVVNTPLVFMLRSSFYLEGFSENQRDCTEAFLISSGFKIIIAKMNFQLKNKSENLSKALERFMSFFFT